jgi:hypothetical protein
MAFEKWLKEWRGKVLRSHQKALRGAGGSAWVGYRPQAVSTRPEAIVSDYSMV